MKALLLVLLLALPAAAHPTHVDHFPNTLEASEVDSDAFLQEYVNHGFITGYGRPEVIYGYDVVIREGRLVVPTDAQRFFKYPYNEMVTSW